MRGCAILDAVLCGSPTTVSVGVTVVEFFCTLLCVGLCARAHGYTCRTFTALSAVCSWACCWPCEVSA